MKEMTGSQGVGRSMVWWHNSNNPRERLELTAADGCARSWDTKSPLSRLVQPSAVPTTWGRIFYSGINPNRRVAPLIMPSRAWSSQADRDSRGGT